MTHNFRYTPFPFNVTPTSPLVHLSPIASNTSLGWAPSCFTPECTPNASWSTSAINSTLLLPYWGWDVTFDGSVKGNISVQLLRDGVQETWNPSGDTLFSFRGGPIDFVYPHNITLKVVDASPGAQLTVTRARVNGSTGGDDYVDTAHWILPSSDENLKYTGFVPQPSVALAGSPTTHISSRAGDTVSMQFNASTFLIYGPCGPTSALMRVTTDGQQATVNTSKPFPSDDCLLFQVPHLGLAPYAMHQLLIENLGAGTLGVNRLEFMRILPATTTSSVEMRVIMALCGGASVVTIIFLAVCMRIQRKRKQREEAGELQAAWHWFKLPCM